MSTSNELFGDLGNFRGWRTPNPKALAELFYDGKGNYDVEDWLMLSSLPVSPRFDKELPQTTQPYLELAEIAESPTEPNRQPRQLELRLKLGKRTREKIALQWSRDLVDLSRLSGAITQFAKLSNEIKPIQPLSRFQLLEILSNLSAAQFELVSTYLVAPVELLPGKNASQAERASSLFRWVEQEDKIDELSGILEDVSPPKKASNL